MSPWLTKLVLNPRNRDIRRILDDAGRQHRWLMHLAPEGLGDQPRREAGLLYRVDDTGHTTTIIAQTNTEPLIDRLPTHGVTTVHTRQLTPLLDALQTGAAVRYRIVANPTKRWGNSAPDKAMIGKLHTLRGPAAEQWWAHRAAACGLTTHIIEWQPLPDATVRGRGRHARARFDGLATVADPNALRAAVTTGIGRSQSFGCGLLSLALHRTGTSGRQP